MTLPRSVLVDRKAGGIYHCIHRCVRGAFLCGDEFEHRKQWILERLQTLTQLFTIDVCGYAVMSNHLHVVLRTNPGEAEALSDHEVARRWLQLFPARAASGSQAGAKPPGPPRIALVRQLAGDTSRIAVLRERLGNLSWFMRCLAEPIARRANREDGCTGRFWEGRFKSHPLLDDAAVLACLVYVDLNPVRAGLAPTPEQSCHTSVQDRIHVRQHFQKLRGRRRHAPTRAASLLTNLEAGRKPRHAEDGLWLAPIEARRRTADSRTVTSGHRRARRRRGLLFLTLEQYLKIVDATGRLVRAGKAGVIPGRLKPILDRLAIEDVKWSDTMKQTGRLFGSAAGSATQLASEAVRRGCRWVIGAMDVYSTSTPA